MNKYIIFLFIGLAALFLLMRGEAEHKKTVIHKISSEQITEIDEKEEKKIREAENSLLETTSSSDSYSDENEHDKVWEENVKAQLLRQAYDDSFDISITKEDSFSWKELGRPIKVKSVKVQLRNMAGETSSFRAIVDPSNGKILRTWDRPVIDPINPRESRGIKLNPLYHPQD
ncbi:MAG TPA: hypothetical protein VKZ84_00305 [Bacteriovoracaceae bacterium]|nr:hypothetical protein [Bacteriovoracaceae bacterium]